MSKQEFFPQRSDARPQIYAYRLPGVASHDGYIKIGQTSRDVNARIREQLHTSGVRYELLWQASAVRSDGTSFSDHDIHQQLKSRGFRQLRAGEDRNEWYKCKLEDVRAAYIAVRDRVDNLENRTQTFAMRPEQQAAVAKTIAYYASSKADSIRTPQIFVERQDALWQNLRRLPVSEEHGLYKNFNPDL